MQKLEEDERQDADIRVKLTRRKKSEYKIAAAQDLITDGVSVWLKGLAERRIREQKIEREQGVVRQAWVCPVCKRVNAPWVASCECGGKDGS